MNAATDLTDFELFKTLLARQLSEYLQVNQVESEGWIKEFERLMVEYRKTGVLPDWYQRVPLVYPKSTRVPENKHWGTYRPHEEVAATTPEPAQATTPALPVSVPATANIRPLGNPTKMIFGKTREKILTAIRNGERLHKDYNDALLHLWEKGEVSFDGEDFSLPS